YERNAGQPQPRDGGVGVAGRIRATGGEADIAPADAGVGQRRAAGVDGHIEAADAVMAAERVDPDADDRDIRAAHDSSPGANAKVSRGPPSAPSASCSVTRIGIPIRSRSGSRSVRIPSTRISPPSST